MRLVKGRSLSHVTLRYALDRAREMYFRTGHHGAPWLVPASIPIIECWLRKSDVALEFGAGRSTVWFARRVGRLISIESDPYWYRKVGKSLRTSSCTNVDLRLCTTGSYVEEVIASAGHQTVDFVLVDGGDRAQATLLAMRVLRPGGLLVIDNANRYMPSRSRAPLGSVSPGPPSAEWASVSLRLAAWRRIWLSSGVTDTALFFCPPQ